MPWGQAVEHISDKPDTKMTFRLFGNAATYTHYQDDGIDFNYQKGEYNQYVVSVTADAIARSSWITMAMLVNIKPLTFN